MVYVMVWVRVFSMYTDCYLHPRWHLLAVKCVQIGLDFGLHSVASHLMCGAKMLFSNQMMFGWFSTNALQMIRSRFSAHEPCTGPVSSWPVLR